MKGELKRLKAIADGLLNIPATEPFIGHFQVAMQEALQLIVKQLERIERNVKP